MSEMYFTPGQDVFEIQTEFYEGPFDLLLHLIRKNKMNIFDIDISEITSEYLSYLDSDKGINPAREGEFLMTASTLIYIKSRSLLPRPGSPDEDSPEKRLFDTLIEYDKIQKISKLLREMELKEMMLWKREDVSGNFESKEFDLESVSSFQLAEIFLNLIKKEDGKQVLYLNTKNYSIEDKEKEILEYLNKNGMMNFNKYIEDLDSIEEILVSFFTILELIKIKKIIAIQKKIFDTISVWKYNTGEIIQ